MHQRSPYRASIVAALALTCLTPSVRAGIIVNPTPDPCLETDFETLSFEYEFPGAVPDPPASLPNCVLHVPDVEVLDGRALAVLSHGNGFLYESYDHLLGHLAANGMIAAACSNAVPMLDVVADLKSWLGLAATTKVALLGHSFGGGRAVEAANENAGLGFPHRVQAVVGIAPVAPVGLDLPATAVSSYFALYGSRDNDTVGWELGWPGPGNLPNAGFAAYDRAGTEADTSGGLILTKPMTKAMAFVYGADHDGFTDNQIPCYADVDYLTIPTQQCIARAYVTGFLRWRLLGHQAYTGMFKGDWMPPSIAAATTSAADGWGNPAGSPVRIFTQFSPGYRRVVANFEAPTPISKSPSLTAVRTDTFSFDLHSPHDTTALRVRWTSQNATQFLELTVPAGPDQLSGTKRNVSNLGYLSFRAGQIYDEPGGFAQNPFNQDQDFVVYLVDEDGAAAGAWVSGYASIPFPDRHELEQGGACAKDGDFSKSAMPTTVRMPLSAFRGIDLTRVEHVTFAFPRSTLGNVFIDNVEFTAE